MGSDGLEPRMVASLCVVPYQNPSLKFFDFCFLLPVKWICGLLCEWSGYICFCKVDVGQKSVEYIVINDVFSWFGNLDSFVAFR